MIKQCVVKDGVVINIGPWDYKIEKVEVGVTETGEIILEERVSNPLPDGAEIVEKEVVRGDDGGIYVAGDAPPPPIPQQVAQLQAADLDNKEAIASLFEMMLTGGL